MNRVSRREDVLMKSVGLVRLRDLLCLNRWWSTPELAAELGVSERTALRWLLEMDGLFFPIEERKESGCGNRFRYRRLA